MRRIRRSRFAQSSIRFRPLTLCTYDMANLSVATRRKESESRVIFADYSTNDRATDPGATPAMFQPLVHPLSNCSTNSDCRPGSSVAHRGNDEGNMGHERWRTYAGLGNPAATATTHEHGDSISTNASGVTNGLHSQGFLVKSKLPDQRDGSLCVTNTRGQPDPTVRRTRQRQPRQPSA
jgi:hypothetical protein